MLRFHKFTIGHGWRSDYGDPDKAADFPYLLAYSPLHNVRMPQQSPRQYPAMLLTTGDHDDRVVPLHSHKLLAALQHCAAHDEADEQRNPLIARIEVRTSMHVSPELAPPSRHHCLQDCHLQAPQQRLETVLGSVAVDNVCMGIYVSLLPQSCEACPSLCKHNKGSTEGL